MSDLPTSQQIFEIAFSYLTALHDQSVQLARTSETVWNNTLLIPLYAVVCSLVILTITALVRTRLLKKWTNRIRGHNPPTAESTRREALQHFPFGSIREELEAHVSGHGGFIQFASNTIRLGLTLSLLGLSIYAAIAAPGPKKRVIPLETFTDDYDPQSNKKWKKPKRHKGHHPGEELFSTSEWLEIAQCAFYVYTTFLALFTLVARPRLTNILSKHLTILLLISFAVFFWRDLLPFGFVAMEPTDPMAWLTWVRGGVLTAVALVLPSVTPHIFKPVDPSANYPPNPEQTASLLSFVSFSFLDPLIYKASRVDHLPYDELPVLADYDRAEFLTKNAWPVLDPAMKPVKGRHLFWGLMWLYRFDYAFLAIFMSLKVFTSLAGPIALNRILLYLEGGKDITGIRPWVWIILLSFSPLLGSVAMQLYIFITTRLLVRTEGVITQLVFEHALKIRATDDSTTKPADGIRSGTSTAVQTPTISTSSLPDEVPSDEIGADISESSTSTAAGTEVQVVGAAASKDVKDASRVGGPGKPTDTKKSDEASGSNLSGKITNLVSTDLGNITDGRDFLFVILSAPLQAGLSIWFLYEILGWSSLVGLTCMLLTLPIPGKIAQILHKIQIVQMKDTDARVQAVTETLSVMRMIKSFGWRSKVERQVAEKREVELKSILRRTLWSLFNDNVNFVLPLLTMIATFLTFTLIMGRELTASRIFSSIALFEALRDQFHIVFYFVPAIISAKVSLDRVNTFLNTTELLDRYNHVTTPSHTIVELTAPTVHANTIGFRNASFTWRAEPPAGEVPGTGTPRRRNFRLSIEGDLVFKSGQINLIVGPTGCGKTSLLMALLGEMHYKPEGIDSFFNLPRTGGVAYAAQEAWIQNATIKENIVFGSEYHDERYMEVLRQCALEKDLTLFEAGDATEIGEKGVTLSGGQKARVSLARALYSSANILLLDDVLSALDVHTSRWIVDHCLNGDLVAGRTVLLVTHNVAMATPVADFVVSLTSNGRVKSQGTIEDALRKDRVFASEATVVEEIDQKEAETVGVAEGAKPLSTAGKLVAKEEIVEGRVGFAAFRWYFGMFGGIGFWGICFMAIMMAQLLDIGLTWFLGFWAKQYNTHPASEVDVPWYLTRYGLMLLAGVIAYCTGYTIFIFGSIKASKKVHETLMHSIMGTTLRWMDETPTGRIVARFTRDIRAIDSSISRQFANVVELTLHVIMRFVAVLVYSPVFLIPGIVIGAVGAWLGQVYIRAQLAVKREMSNAKSPIYSHFGAAIAGLTTIRAFGVEERFTGESKSRIDYYTRAGRTFYNLNRWISLRIDALGGVFSAALGSYLVYSIKVDPSTTGFSLTMALAFTGSLLWWVRCLNELEVEGNSIERIKGYVEIDQEPQWSPAGQPPAYWPSSGTLRVDKLSARYSIDGPEVLHDISFEVQSGEHIGVVGRTGAGKSSLSLALLRLIPTTGNVIFDGLDVKLLNLDALRGNVTIIPQQPELMSGSLRQNLDPFDEHDDATLNGCLRSAGLFDLQAEDSEDSIGLDTPVVSGGTNFSLGQRQIIALARAMVRRSKIYLLDEATASVDYKTDAAIQEVIASEFKEMTLIIVAHRLQTIMSADKVLVLDSGRVMEFDSPQALLQKEGSFRALVDGSGDRELLYAMAKKGPVKH